MASLIAVEGIDGSGKGTQAQRLHERLNAAGVRTALLSFPRYNDTLFGKAIGDFLNGRFGKLNEVSPFLASLLYAGDRFESRSVILQALNEHDAVVCDRYVASNIAHQASKLEGDERAELIRWIEQIEFEIYELPRPTLTLLLDMPVSQAQQLIAAKQPRTYTEKKADLQEADAPYLEKVRQVYLHLANSTPTWHRIDCLHEGRLRTVEAINDELHHLVEAHQ